MIVFICIPSSIIDMVVSWLIETIYQIHSIESELSDPYFIYYQHLDHKSLPFLITNIGSDFYY